VGRDKGLREVSPADTGVRGKVQTEVKGWAESHQMWSREEMKQGASDPRRKS